MTKEEFRDALVRCQLRQVDAAWICGVGERHVRAWVSGRYPVPQYAALLVTAYEQGKITANWLIKTIGETPP